MLPSVHSKPAAPGETTAEPANDLQSRKEQLLAELSEGLPTLPAYVFELSTLLTADPVNLKRVNQIIRTDPSLTAQVLRLCNSALFALPRKLTTIEQAVMMLGTERLRTLVLTCSMVEFLGPKVPATAIRSFWQHSLLTALLTDHIAQQIGRRDTEFPYLAGLLHDIGILPLLTLATREKSKWPVETLEKIGESNDVQKELFGVDHCQVGSWLGVAWNFAPVLVEVFEHHHDPARAVHDAQLVSMVAVADQYCISRGVMVGGSLAQVGLGDRNRCEAILEQYLPELAAETRDRLAQSLETECLRHLRLLETSSSGMVGSAISGKQASRGGIRS